MGWNQNSSKREVYSNRSLPPEIRKISNKHPKLMPKATRERTNNTHSIKNFSLKHQPTKESAKKN